MGDVFIERMIKKKFETMDMLILLGIVVAMIVVVFIGFIVGFFIFPFPMLTFLVALGAANMWLAIFADVGVMVLAVLNAIRALFVKKL